MNNNKSTKKRNNYNEDIINALADKYGFSQDYIRKCLRSDRTGIMPDNVKKDYKELEKASQTAIKSKINPSK